MVHREAVVSARVSAAVAVDVATLLRRRNIDPEPVFKEAGIDGAATRDPYEQIPLERYTCLLELAAQAVELPMLGLELGLQQDPAKWGAYGFVVLNSPTIGAALNNMATGLKAAQSSTHMAYLRTDHAIGIEYSILDPYVVHKAQDAEFAIAYVRHVMDRLCERLVKPVEIQFEHNPLSDMAIYRRKLGITPVFDQPVNAIYFPRNLEDRPVRSADVHLFPVIKQHLADMAGAMPDERNLVESVAYQVRQSLAARQCQLPSIASALATAPRTLQRRLKEEGTSLAAIVDDVRRELALQYMDNSAMELKEISYLLGYCDASAFIKAFRKWTGETPAKYRDRRI